MAEAASFKLGDLKALTYDSTHDIFYFSDAHKNKDYTNINSLKLKQDGTIQIKTIIQLNDRNINIEDLVYDFNDDILFYSDRDNERIMKINFDRSNIENVTAMDEIFISTNGKPSGLELDACKRNLYFTVTSDEPTINVISIKEKNSKPICKGKHHQPIAIALDQSNDRIYIADKSSNIYFINSFTKDGEDFKVELKSNYRTPRSLAVDHENVYYLDGRKHELRKLPKHGPAKNSSEFVMTFVNDPMDVVVRSNFVDAMKVDLSSCDVTEGRLKELRNAIERIRMEDKLSCIAIPSKVSCLHGGTYDEDSSRCVCKDLRYDGELCEIDLCYNFCMNGGECSMKEDFLTSRLIPKCSCTNGYTGDRCEIDVCSNFCLNSGRCISIKQKPTCECTKDYFGKRCENEHQNFVTQPVDVQMVASSEHTTTIDMRTTSDEDEVVLKVNETSRNPQFTKCPIHVNLTYIICAICLTLSLLFFLIILLIIRRFHKPMRPRIRKKFVVHKNIEPMTYRPTTEQCEVIIEDCCNMNICDTVLMTLIIFFLQYFHYFFFFFF